MDTKQKAVKRKKLSGEGGEQTSALECPSAHDKAELGLDSLPAAVLREILAYSQPQDAVKLRATCNNLIMTETDAHLYKTSVEKLSREAPVRYDREFLCDNCAYISIRPDGKFRDKAEAIDLCLESKLNLSEKQKSRATNELSKDGITKGRSKKKFWKRTLSIENDLSNKEMMHIWSEFCRKLMDWQESYIDCSEHIPEEKRATLEPVNDIRGILFGLYVGSNLGGGGCSMTLIQREGYSKCIDTTSDEYYFLLSGPHGEKFVLETQISTFHETYYGH